MKQSLSLWLQVCEVCEVCGVCEVCKACQARTKHGAAVCSTQEVEYSLGSAHYFPQQEASSSCTTHAYYMGHEMKVCIVASSFPWAGALGRA